MSASRIPHLILTAGEPSGIGPDIVVSALADAHDAAITVIGDVDLLQARALQLGVSVKCEVVDRVRHHDIHTPGIVRVIHMPAGGQVVAGIPATENASALVHGIDLAVDLCLEGTADAMVTAPLHKAIINDAGIPFQGHTEWIADRCGGQLPVMMLAGPTMRVCLATTHLPLSRVPENITADRLARTIRIMHEDIQRLYALERPAIGVLGLNPHAGEGGHLGREEIDVIEPTLEILRGEGLNLIGPLPADTAFTLQHLASLDAVLAMYHDQGLPVVKHQGFGDVVNVTLGLPIIRTSVDHGTALELAGTGKASDASLRAALDLARTFALNKVEQATA